MLLFWYDRRPKSYVAVTLCKITKNFINSSWNVTLSRKGLWNLLQIVQDCKWIFWILKLSNNSGRWNLRSVVHPDFAFFDQAKLPTKKEALCKSLALQFISTKQFVLFSLMKESKLRDILYEPYTRIKKYRINQSTKFEHGGGGGGLYRGDGVLCTDPLQTERQTDAIENITFL